MILRKAYTLLVLLFAVALSACSSSSSDAPVKSQISTYDTTFTQSVRGNTEKVSKKRALGTASFAFAKPKSFLNRDAKATKEPKPYFVEFRARNALNYGHASVVFGKLRNGKIPVNSKGVLDPKLVQITGLHPATNDPKQWLKGHVVPVPAETGPSDGDFEDAYVTARYQINLTRKEFNKLVRIVKKHKRSYPHWYAVNYATNCLGYMGSIAEDMGMKVPAVPKFPKEFVQKLKAMNS